MSDGAATSKRRPWRTVWSFVRPVAIAYLTFVLMLSLFERMLVFPAPPVDSADWSPAELAPRDVEFAAADGTRLHGWYVDHPNPSAVVLYCHGNGEHVAHLAERLQELRDQTHLAVFAWDYRGYGKSQGKPHEENVVADVRAAQLCAAREAGVRPEQIVLLGRSLGGGAAVQLAARYPVRGLVLERTFAELVEVAAHHFPWLPVRWIMKNEFRSIDHIGQYDGPLLQVHGMADEIVPFQEGKRLFDACPSRDKRFVAIKDGTHNEPLSAQYERALEEFLANLQPAGVQPQRAPSDL